MLCTPFAELCSMSFAGAKDHCRILKCVSNVFLSRFYSCAEVNGAGMALANIMVASPLAYSYHDLSAAPSPQNNRNTEM